MGLIEKVMGGQQKTVPRAAPREVAVAMNQALKELRGRVAAMKHSARSERANCNSVSRDIESLEKQRITRISLARLEGKDPFIEDLDEKLKALRQKIEDAEAIEVRLAEMAEEQARALNRARFEARRELAAELDARFAAAAESYNQAAPALIAAARELLAMRELMIKIGAGNTNGFDLAVALPQARPGEGQTLRPLFSVADSTCMVEVKRRSDEIARELEAIGFELVGE